MVVMVMKKTMALMRVVLTKKRMRMSNYDGDDCYADDDDCDEYYDVENRDEYDGNYDDDVDEHDRYPDHDDDDHGHDGYYDDNDCSYSYGDDADDDDISLTL